MPNGSIQPRSAAAATPVQAVGGPQVPSAVVIGQLADSYTAFQAELSAQLAPQHAPLAEALCLEVLQRRLGRAGGSVQHSVRRLGCCPSRLAVSQRPSG